MKCSEFARVASESESQSESSGVIGFWLALLGKKGGRNIMNEHYEAIKTKKNYSFGE